MFVFLSLSLSSVCLHSQIKYYQSYRMHSFSMYESQQFLVSFVLLVAINETELNLNERREEEE